MDGLSFSGLLSEPTSPSDTIIIHIHGMAGDFYSNAYYSNMYEKYPTNGIAFLAGENRGTHNSTNFSTTKGSRCLGNSYEAFEECVHDIQSWINYALSLNYQKIWLQAHSLGTSKIAYYITSSPQENIAGQIWLSPSDNVGLVHDPVGFMDHKVLLPEAKKYTELGKPTQLLSQPLWSEHYLSAQTYINLFDKNTKTAIFNYSAPKLGWDVVNNISVPVIALTGTKDDGIEPVMDPHEAMRLLEKQLRKSPKVKTVVFENAAHDFEGFETQIIENTIQFILETGN
jgi:pimeloyl-ACP methyl ester carboxylesterase